MRCRSWGKHLVEARALFRSEKQCLVVKALFSPYCSCVATILCGSVLTFSTQIIKRLLYLRGDKEKGLLKYKLKRSDINLERVKKV